MRFLYVCADQGIPILGTKGASVHVREFANALMDLGHEVHVVCARIGEGNEAGRLAITEIRLQDDVSIIKKEASRHARAGAFTPSEVGNSQSVAKLLRGELERLAHNRTLHRSLEQIVEREQPDLIYERYSLFADAAASVARQFGLPHLLEVNAPLIEERQSTRGLILTDVARRCEDRVFDHAGCVLTVSSSLREYVVERGVPRDKVIVIENGVDIAKFSSARGRESRTAGMLRSLGLSPELSERIIVGFVGSLKPWHGVDTLIVSIARAREVDSRLALLIVGEGPELGPLKSQVMTLDLGGHVHFTGAVPHWRVPDYIGVMDITVAPYRHQGRFYFSPLKILEYMAMAKPVIATSQGQISELIESGENGILCEPEDVAQFADALIRLAADPLLRRRLGQNAEGTVTARASWHAVAERVASIARSVVGPTLSESILEKRVIRDPQRRSR